MRGEQILETPKLARQTEDLKMLIRIICLCHGLTRVKTEDKGNFLTGSSQDELEHMEMCEKANIGKFIERDSEIMKIEVFGEIEVWRNLRYFEFSSDRKFMTRTLQNT